MVQIRRATEADGAVVAEIYNQGIEDRIATYETALRSSDQMARRILENPDRYPVLVAAEDATVLGWAGLAGYRPRECYSGIAEYSVYVHRAARGKGVGKALMAALIDEARRLGYWKILSRIFPFNTGSLKLCREFGFREVGIYEKHARLDGRWLDVVIVERLIRENQPED